MSPEVFLPLAVPWARSWWPDYQVEGLLRAAPVLFSPLDAFVDSRRQLPRLRLLSRPLGRAGMFPRPRDQPRAGGVDHGRHGGHGRGFSPLRHEGHEEGRRADGRDRE